MMERGWKHNTEISPSCPRCGSCNTKFCYFNNYSLSQPRYFCKGCRRYWTKGGSLRNVPVGGGCRKTRRHTNKALRHSAVPPPIAAHGHPNYDPSTASSPSSSVATDHPPHIDLALIYANFLSRSADSSEEPHDQFMQTLGFDPCVEYSSLSDRAFGLSEPSTIESHGNVEDHQMYFGGLFDSMQEHKEDRIIDIAINFELPPLPGEEVASHDDMMMWSDSLDEMMENRTLQTSLPPILGSQPHVNGNWGSFHSPTNVSFPSP